ncbi:uncharacterized protein RCC_01699 [Ramularia collo-cygni]|uniref:Heme haloperoxidase family profile domain-containing protein n=1 Tax=Ramularia collo-cygni TaxID=112498 RepID=A0A2D3UMY2_9PEZI|nr:uncharacterized protein RCC_01699 [Ramularia collo-cygni]CZT15861.1 uncharacterized protein RCC_01699 [Ramularia collo-cygni]
MIFRLFYIRGELLASRNILSGAFNLDDLDLHDYPIEHDASLSRQDKFFGEWTDFNQTIFNQVLEFYEGMDIATIPATAAAKYARVQDSQKRNPHKFCTDRESFF